MSIDQKAAMLPPMMSMQQSVGSLSPPDLPADASSSSLSANNQMFTGGGGPMPFDSKDPTETTPQFKPRSHYAQPYYQSTSGGQQQQQQQQSMSPGGGGGGNMQNAMGQSYPRNSLTPETRQNSMGDHHLHHPSHQQQQQQQMGYNQTNAAGAQPPPLPPSSRMSNNVANNNMNSNMNNNNMNNVNSNDNQYPGAGNAPGPMYGGGPRRSFGQNGIGGGPPGTRQSLIDRSSTSGYMRQDDSGAGPQPHRDSRLYRQNQYDGGGGSMDDESTDPSLPRRNTKYVNRESLYSFQQVNATRFGIKWIGMFYADSNPLERKGVER